MALNIPAIVKAFNAAGIPVTADFHALSMRQVAVIAEQAQLAKYRAPKSASGSTARCFFAAVVRKASANVLNAAKMEAILDADAETDNVGLPSYSQLLSALRKIVVAHEQSTAEHSSSEEAAYVNARRMLSEAGMA